MKKVYFTKYRVTPDPRHCQMDGVEGAYALTWIQAKDILTAHTKSYFFIEKSGFMNPEIETPPVEVQRYHFHGKELGLKYFDQCLAQGHAICFEGWGKKFQTPQEIPIQNDAVIDMEQMWKDKKRISQRKRCLHFDAGENCNEIVAAHSVQKNRSLSAIAENGHVCQIDLTAIRNPHNEKSLYSLVGINKATTFLGFCKHHDNEVFQPIDDYDLAPTAQQAILYAYRALCREIHYKMNAIEFEERLLDNNPKMNPAIKRKTEDFSEGIKIGLESLNETKQLYDDVLKNQLWTDVRFTVFNIEGAPNMAFSGGVFPDHDFLGRSLQNIADPSTPNHTLTFCSAPMKDGWGIIFCWHKEHEACCSAVMSSLATIAYDGHNISDALFRYTISSCENLAIKPSWYDSLPEEKKKEIENVIRSEVDIMCAIDSERYTKGLDGIVDWKLKEVITNGTRSSNRKE